MIYVSSSCVRAKTVREVAEKLVREGFKNIEWSGGTIFEENVEQELLNLQQQFGFNFLLHNYFPAPEKAFVLNLASLDEEIAQLSFNHIKKAIQLSKSLGADRYAFHAGFLIHIPVSEIGKSISPQVLFPREKAWEIFRVRFEKLREFADFSGVRLYLENNVLSSVNLKNFNGENPFFLTNYSEALQHKGDLNCSILLDTGHLKVSSNSLKLDFETELAGLLSCTDYVHLSDNDGFSDKNEALLSESALFQLLKVKGLSGKTLTLEVYSGMEDLRKSYQSAEILLN